MAIWRYLCTCLDSSFWNSTIRYIDMPGVLPETRFLCE